MALIYLLRHAESVANENGVLAGQDFSVNLSKQGQRQAQLLVTEINKLEIKKSSQVFSSPLPRCLQTIKPFLDEKFNSRPATILPEFIEMNYGDWQGEKLKKLARKKEWRTIQSKPAQFRFPNGESFTQAFKRVKNGLEFLANFNSDSIIVTHGDIIKMAVAHALAIELNKFQKIHVSPASLTVLRFEKNDFQVVSVNRRLSESDNRMVRYSRIKALLGGSSA